MFNTKKQARAHARELSIDVESVYEQDGKWFVPEVANENVNTITDENGQPAWAIDEHGNEYRDVEQPTDAPVATDVTVNQPSAWASVIAMPDLDVSKPVAFVWAFLSANRGRTRKELINALINDIGLNPNMVKTQTSRWFSVDGDKAAYLALEKAKRDAEKARIDAMVAEMQAKAKADEQAVVDEQAQDAEGEQPSE